MPISHPIARASQLSFPLLLTICAAHSPAEEASPVPQHAPTAGSTSNGASEGVSQAPSPATAAGRTVEDSSKLAVGPVLGHIDATTAHVWMRASSEGPVTLILTGPTGQRTFEADATAASDHCVVWTLDKLTPDTPYTYATQVGDGPLRTSRHQHFTTAPDPTEPSIQRLAFGSCASSDPSSVWSTIALRAPDGLVLMGDTPYIDTTDLEAARAKHRRFLEIPGLARLALDTPIWATWDDHDFGGNDTNGSLPGKEHTRRAFVEHRALASYGHDDEGIYTSFRRGGLEVFLLDTRYFAGLEPMGPDDDRSSLLGTRQRQWLEQGLRTSTAPFKLLACGMIWDDKQNTESDDWGTYSHEREHIERFLGEHSIAGVVLLGGDIHVSRHLSYPESKERVGYTLDQLIVSPLHDRVIPSLDVPHPALLWSSQTPRTFLTLEADTTTTPPRLTAHWIQDTGHSDGTTLRTVSWTLEDLTR